MLRSQLRRVPRTTAMVATLVVLIGTLLGGGAIILRATFFRPVTVTAYFTAATAIYVGDTVRVAGIKVGSVAAIEPEDDRVKMTLAVDRDVPIPVDAKAVIVAQNLVAARYVQLAPTYQPGDGPTMKDGAVIPIARTAVPVEWDEIKRQLMRLATDLGPGSSAATTPTGRFIDSAANALGGNAEKLRQTLAQLSGVGRIMADRSGNLVDIIKNLQTFVSALRDSNTQIVQFEDRLATLTGVLNESRSDLDTGLTTLSTAIDDVQRFVTSTGNQTAEQVARLAKVTQILADERDTVANVLHLSPTAVANAYSAYDPDTGTLPGTFVFTGVSNLIQSICGAVGANANITAPETGKLCGLFLGPALNAFNFNGLPIPVNPYLTRSPDPGRLIYSEPNLAPGGNGPKPGPREIPPAVSAYQPGDAATLPFPVMATPPALTNLPRMSPPASIAPLDEGGTAPTAPASPPVAHPPPFPPGEGKPPA